MQDVATFNKKKDQVNQIPPKVNQISPNIPDVTFLKLMIASNNSSAHVANVFEGIFQQSSLTGEDFFGTLSCGR